VKGKCSRGGMPHIELPEHWRPEQALAVFEALHAMTHALWLAYGEQAQQAWCDQLMPDGPPPDDFDPDAPF
jgi:hypothetical protein